MAENQDTTAPKADQAEEKLSAKLQKQLDKLTLEKDELGAENGQLKGQVISLSADRDTLADANLKLQADLEEKTSELEQAETLIEELTGKLAAAEVGQLEGPVVVTHEKEQYRVLAPKFSHHGLDVDAHTLRNNPDLVRQLVEDGSGLLQKVGTKQEPAK